MGKLKINSIQTKFLLWMGISLLLIAAFIITYAATTMRNAAIEDANVNAVAIAQSHAGQIKAEIELALDVGRTMAQSLKAVKRTQKPISLTRDQVNGMLAQVLEDNPNFLGTYTLWEPNAFDGLDAEYVNALAHDETGRFIPYWVRGDEGEIFVEALLEYETEGIGDWYLLPRETKQEQVLDPFLYPIQGVDVLLTSLVTPIVVDEQFYGIAGVDLKIGSLQQLTEDADIFNGTGRMVLISTNGTLAGATGHPELVGQSVTELSENYIDDLDNIQQGEAFTKQYGDDLAVFVPIVFGNAETPWSVNILIPNEQIIAEATDSMWQMISFGALIAVAALVLLWFVVRQLTRPIRDVTNAAIQVAGGNLDVHANVTSSDELGTLANAFNTMTSQLRESIGTLEQSVADRTKALTTSTEVSRRLSTILNREELVREVVNQVQSAFDYYHAHIYLLEGDELVMAGGTGEAGTKMLAEGHKIPKGRGLVGRAAESNEAVLVPDTSQDPNWLPNDLLPDTKSEVAIPISVGTRVLGVLDVQHNVADGLDQEDVDSLQSIANQVAAALQNISQYENTQKMAADLEVVANVGIATSTITEGRHLLQEVVDLSKQSFELYHAHVYLLNETGDTLGLASGAGEVGRKMVAEGHAIPLDSEKSLVARAARTREGVVVNDVQANPDFLPNPLLPETRAEMAVPMIVSGKVIGVLDVQAERVDRFTDIDVSIQTTLASQVAVALQNASSFADAQKQAERETRLNTITQKIQNAATIEEAMQIAARELGHALGKRQTFVALDPRFSWNWCQRSPKRWKWARCPRNA